MRVFWGVLFVALVGCGSAVGARAQEKPMSDSQYVAQALSSAPRAIASDAAVVRQEKNGMWRTLRTGKNGFTCMVMGTDRMCNDENAMEFFRAVMDRTAPPEKLGISYMLAGDLGASNTDPYATAKTATNHWIVTGPHIMIVGASSKALKYTRAKDPDPNKPYMMWVGTPYEHAMIPLGPPN